MKKQLLLILTPIVLVFVFVFLMSLLRIGIPVQVTQNMTTTELSVTGEGKVDIVPNTATVDVGVRVNRAATVDAAQSQINETNNAIIAAMQKLGIEKQNIKTSNYSVYPSYDYSSGRDVLTGYDGNVTLSIKTKNVDQISQVISAATEAGANEIQNTRFEVEDPAAYRAEARKKAIDNAKEEAKKLADELGIKLGKVVNVVEHTSSGTDVYPYMAERAVGLGGGGGASFEPGSQAITSVVTLYFEKR
ncbi:SIMPL domain-containing protein [Candidatus Roizmanbacteria bacterium]|nr:MAG: SIMPL domain-containing protein [Candidatus Roizmanbacteria bacterium]